VKIAVENLPGGEIGLDQNPVPLEPGQTIQRNFELRVRRWKGAQDVNRIRLVAQPANERTPDVFPMTFILPQ
jgi:hypothetical protein